MRLGAAGIASALAAGSLVLLSSQPAAAIAPVGEVVLNVTDCRTGQPIPTGQAVFSIPHKFAAGVAPIVNGVAGPVGLGRNHYRLTITSPGYERLQRMLKGDGNFSTTTTLAYCLHPHSP